MSASGSQGREKIGSCPAGLRFREAVWYEEPQRSRGEEVQGGRKVDEATGRFGDWEEQKTVEANAGPGEVDSATGQVVDWEAPIGECPVPSAE